MDLVSLGMDREIFDPSKFVGIDVELHVEATFVGGAALVATCRVAKHLADVGEVVVDAVLVEKGANAAWVAVLAERALD